MGQRTCSVTDCGKPVNARGWCSMHYARWRQTGEVGTAASTRRADYDCSCSVSGCEKPAKSRELCTSHYSNLTQYGHTIAVRHWPPLAQLLRVGWDITEDGCWEWRGSVTEKGYGLHGGQRTHRLMYTECVGPLGGDEVIRHRCDNPPCCNPDHLEPGSPADNSADMVARRRHWLHDRSHCKNGHDVTESGALKVVTQKDRKPYNACVRCDANRKLRWELKQRAS